MLQIIKSKTLNFIIKNNNILEWSLWKKLQKKPLFNFQLLTLIFFTIIFYLPFLNSNILDFNFLQYGDNAILWLPQLLSSYIYNNDFIFKGIDFYTHGGASEYFLRPNLIIYNPIILILSYVVNFGNLFNVFIFTLTLIIFFSIVPLKFLKKMIKINFFGSKIFLVFYYFFFFLKYL